MSKDKRVYVFGSVMPFGEDGRHEFKGHRNLSVEEIPKQCTVPGTRRVSRQPVSRTLNGFFNTGKGGTVYLGVLGSGTVKGLVMSDHQINHVKLSLADLMNRYTPPVSKRQYTVSFIPVVSKISLQDDDIPLLQTGDDSAYGSESDIVEFLAYKKKLPSYCQTFNECCASGNMKSKPHLLRTSIYCWCDKQALVACQKGEVIQEYIIEITIFPFSARVPAHPYSLQLHPFYENEEGSCYLRMIASLHLLTHQEISEITRLKAKEHFEKILQSLQEKLVKISQYVTVH